MVTLMRSNKQYNEHNTKDSNSNRNGCAVGCRAACYGMGRQGNV